MGVGQWGKLQGFQGTHSIAVSLESTKRHRFIDLLPPRPGKLSSILLFLKSIDPSTSIPNSPSFMLGLQELVPIQAANILELQLIPHSPLSMASTLKSGGIHTGFSLISCFSFPFFDATSPESFFNCLLTLGCSL